MRIFNIKPSTTKQYDYLNEANVFNIKTDYNGLSIESYIKQYADHIIPPEANTIFTKTLAKYLVNDERFLFAMRSVPDNAPAWAKESVAKGELMVFQPSDQLNTEIEHLMHYMIAVIEGIKNEDNNIRVFAQGEYVGFNKAESLDLLITKSNDFFKRGTKNIDRTETEGMKEILKCNDGYSWFLLETTDAYRKMGKILQNCIGSIWTREKTKATGMEIIVLRGPNDFHVGARINNAENSIMEMKGKNNKPPIEKYMPYVLEVINKLKLNISVSALYDFKNAGYFYIENVLYSRSQAVEKFMNFEEIGKISGGYSISLAEKIPMTLFRDIFPMGYGMIDHSNVSLVNLRDKNNNSVVLGHINNTTLFNITDQKTTESTLTDFIKFLLDNDIIKYISPSLTSHLIWDSHLSIDLPTKTVTKLGNKRSQGTENKDYEWHEITNSTNVQRILTTLVNHLKTNPNVSPDIVKKFAGLEAKSIYMTKFGNTNNSQVVVFLTKDGVLIPLRVDPEHYSKLSALININNIEFSGSDNTLLNTKLVRSLVTLANEENAQLPPGMRVTSGIMGQKGKYTFYQPKKQKLEGTPSGEKIDLSDVPIIDKLAAISRITRFNGSRAPRPYWTPTPEGPDYDKYHMDDFGIDQKINISLNKNYPTLSSKILYWGEKDTEQVFKDVFDKYVPDSIYLFNVKYGSDKEHEIALIADKDKVIGMDNGSSRHRFQGWDDFEKVADQINRFLQNNNLKMTKTAISTVGELRTSKEGLATTVQSQQKEKLSRMKSSEKTGGEGTDELLYNNGWKLIRMEAEEQTKWMRETLHRVGVAGEGWKLVDASNNSNAIFLIKNNKIVDVYKKYSQIVKDPPNTKGIDRSNTPYLKIAREQFGWEIDPKLASVLYMTKDDDYYKVLYYLDTSKNNGIHGTQRTVSKAISPVASSSFKSGNHIMNTLKDYKFVVLSDYVGTRHVSRPRLLITAKGQKALRELQAGRNVEFINDAPELAPADNWQKPEKKDVPTKEKTPNPVSSGKAPKTGSSTERALVAFKAFIREKGHIPSRSEFIPILQAEPFNMGTAGAQTYYYNTKAKYAELGEKYSNQAKEELLVETGSLRIGFGKLNTLNTLLH